MSFNPFHQFEIHPILNLSLDGYDISLTNSSLFMLLAVFLVSSFFYFAGRRATIVPGKLQNMAEITIKFVDDMLYESAGSKAKPFFPFIFTLFTFLLALNLCGMLPYGFSVTSHIAFNFAVAAFFFILVTITGFVRHGFGFLSLFLPSGAPLFIAPLLIVIEFFSFISRPISLSIRLAGNMIAGHVLLGVLGSFVVMMGVYGIIPMPFMVVMVGFEFFVAILQAYIFTILTCVYLNDAINLH